MPKAAKPVMKPNKLSLGIVKKTPVKVGNAGSDNDSELEFVDNVRAMNKTMDNKKSDTNKNNKESNRFAMLMCDNEEEEMDEASVTDAIAKHHQRRLEQQDDLNNAATGRTQQGHPKGGYAGTAAATSATATTRQATTKKERIPNITIEGEQVNAIIELIKKTLKTKDFRVKLISRKRFVLKMSSAALYKKTLNILKLANVQYFTYTLKSERPVTLLLKGLHPETEVLDIKADIEAADNELRVIKVKNFSTPKSVKGGFKLPMFLIQFQAGTKVQKITAIRGVCNQIVKWEKMEKQTYLQCHRCQSFGHSAGNCTLQFRCVKCAGSHEPGQCKITKEVEDKKLLKCALCGEQGHPASYRGCKRFLELKEKFKARKLVTKQTDIQRSVTNSRVATNFVKKNISYANALTGNSQQINTTNADSNMMNDSLLSQTMMEIKSVMLSLHKEVMELKISLNRETARINTIFAMFESP